MNDIIIIKTFANRLEAEIAKSLLEANNIKAFVTADDNGGMDPFPFQNKIGVKLLIHRKDARNAHELLNSQ